MKSGDKCLLCLFLVALRLEFIGPVGIRTVAFALDNSQAARSSHVAHACLCNHSDNKIPPGNARRRENVKVTT